MAPGYSISLADRTRACFRQGTDTGCGVGGAVGVLTGSCLPLLSTPSLCVPDLSGFWGWNSTGTEAYGAQPSVRVPGPIETFHEQMQPNGFGVTLRTITDKVGYLYTVYLALMAMIPFYR